MNILKVVIRKIIVGCISSFILSGYFAYMSYTPSSEQRPEILYWTLGDLWIVSLMYALPVFLIGGTLYSLIIERILYQFNHRKENIFILILSKVIMYALGGVIVTILFLLIITNGTEIIYAPFVLGISGSLTYLLIEELIKVSTKRIMIIQK